MVLLAVGFTATRLARLLRLPHSVFLVLLGLAAGALLSAAGRSPLQAREHFADIVFYLLLPPLVFESAYAMDLELLRRDVVAITSLSVGALVLSTGLVGWGLHTFVGIDTLSALVFGALISATDPVAVVSLFREVGAPRRLSLLVEGESLLNDGTAIVLFRVLLNPLGSHPILTAATQFLYVAVGGVAVGFLCVFVGRGLLRLTSHSYSAQLGLTVAIAYLSFIIADRYLGVSGVMSTMTAGLYLGARARLELNREALRGMHALWDFMALSANTLVFLLVGLAIDPQMVLPSLRYIPWTLGVVYVARGLAVWAAIEPLNWLGWIERISFRYQAVLVWGGLRGGLALALALVLPDTMALKSLFIAMAATVVLANLLINALSIGPTLHALKLDVLNPVEEAFYRHSLSLVLGKVFGPLREASLNGSLSGALLEDVEASTRHLILQDGDIPADCGEAFEVQQILLDEQQFYNQRREADALSREAWPLLTRFVSNRLEVYRNSGLEGLRNYRFVLPQPSRWLYRWLTERQRVHELTIRLEVFLSLDLSLHHKMANEPHCVNIDLLRSWRDQARSHLDELYRSYPTAGAAVQSQFMAKTIAAIAEHALHELWSTEIINAAVYAHAQRHIELHYHRLMADATRLLQPSLSYLLSHVPLLKELPPEALDRLAASARKRTWSPGSVVVKEGETGESFFLVLTGLLEVQSLSGGHRPPARADGAQTVDSHIRLFPGSYFGEMSLLFRLRRTATVVSVLPSELAEIDRQPFEELMSRFPAVEGAVRKTAWERLSQIEDRPADQ